MSGLFRHMAVSLICILLSVPAAKSGMVDTYGIGARATALGGAFAARADDPFAIYYNPAGITQSDTLTLAAGVHFLMPDIDINRFSISGGAADLPQAAAWPHLQGHTNHQDKTTALTIPAFGATMPVNDSISIGFAAYVPWGLEISWEDAPSNPLAYNATRAYYFREVVTPTIAFALNKNISVGAGISIGKSKVMNQWIQAGTGYSMRASMTDDFNTSLNLGVLYTGEVFSMGLTWRGPTSTDFKGDLLANGWKASGVSLKYDHPEQVQAGIRYRPPGLPGFSIEIDGLWTRWSINETQDAHLTPGLSLPGHSAPVTSLAIARNWKDTHQVRVGLEYQTTEKLALRCGFYTDPSPIPDASMDFIWPDADKETWSAGAGYAFAPGWIMDMAVTWTRIINQRHIRGNSEALNESYDMPDGYGLPHAMASFDADGEVFGFAFTFSRHF
ncbi:outer membrane protein transport protein [Desulfobotulus sp. H1]|uniref:Outer membrane protein transport protein n=1 Tax=Desulfobotulus pelophilus TaxID=2823377 RepID=A0ABT3NA62_9BACT|nr:outer membrane protein transport protein [Desulfobotulus pelophilus]MCW7754357.1 outer membrane protein transport protein [Desulfobotulus pelophilus]